MQFPGSLVEVDATLVGAEELPDVVSTRSSFARFQHVKSSEASLKQTICTQLRPRLSRNIWTFLR